MSQPKPPWRLPVTLSGHPIRYEILTAGSALAYFLLAYLGLSFATVQESASPIWPASGFAVALLILAGLRLWPAITLGAFAANLVTGGAATAGFIALGNTLEAVLGMLIFQRIAAIGPSQLPIARSAALILAAIGAPIASAGTGVATLAAAGALSATAIGDVAVTWWAGDTLGILLVTPLLVLWLRQRAAHTSAAQTSILAPIQAPITQPTRSQARHALRLLALIIGVGATGALPFLHPGWDTAFLLSVPLLLATAHWFGGRGTMLVLLVTAAIWLTGTSAGLGPFQDDTLNDSLLNMQIMLAALAAIGLLLADVQHLRSRAAAAVFLVGCVVAGAIFVTQTRSSADIDRHHLKNIAERIQSNVTQRMNTYINALQGGASYFAASNLVSRQDWRNYVQSLRLRDRYPGILGVGVVIPVDKSRVNAFVTTARLDSVPNFTVKPVPDVAPRDAAAPQHFVVLYIEPAEVNAAAIGLDLASEPKRRLAALMARDTDNPAITADITLVQDRKRGPGFLLFMPMYRKTPPEPTAAALRRAFHGWIYAPFTADSFFRTAMIHEGLEVELRIFDGTRANATELMFDSAYPDGAPPARVADFSPELNTQLFLAGHEFTLQWRRSVLFVDQSLRLPIVFCAGLMLFSTLLAALVATLWSQRDRATAIAQQMTAALTASNERFALAVACSRDGIWDYDVASDQVWSSPRYKEIYGYEEADIADHWEFWRSIILAEDYPRARQQYDEMMAGERDGIDMVQRYRHKLGHIVHVHSRALPVRDANGAVARVVGVHTDISLVVSLEQRFKDAINVMADGFGLFDADDRLILFNEGFIDEGTRKVIGDPTGCTFEDVVRAFVYHDMPDAKDPAFDKEGWISRRMERHRNPPQDPIEVKWGGDRWMRISERRTADGGYVGIWSDVTEIKRSGQRLRDAIDALSDGFALFDANDRLVVCNDGFMSESLRAAFTDPTGRSFEEIYRVFAANDPVLAHDIDREKWLQARLLLHRYPPESAYEFVGADGRSTRILERRTSDGGWVGTWTDVTPERKAQQRLQDAISAVADGFALFDADDRLVICNEVFMHDSSMREVSGMGNLVGISMPEILAGFAHSTVTDIRAVQDPEGWIAFRLDRHLNPTEEPYEQILTDGRVFHISERRTSDGGVVGIWSDVTALHQAERRLQDAIASINEGFLLLDADGRYVVFNDKLLDLYPKTAPFVAVGGKFEDALRQGALAGEYPGLDDPMAIDAFVREWTDRFGDAAAFQAEGALADGRWVLVSHHGTSDGGCVNVYTDITVLKQREADLAAAKTRLEKQAEELMATTDDLRTARQAAEEANRSKSSFLADMSHELRTPLNAILGFSDIIRGEMFGKIEQPRYVEYASDIHSSGTHLLQLINDLLDLSKIEANKLTLNVEAVSMRALMDHATKLVAGLAQERGVSVAADQVCPVVHADERQMRQILLNLLSNAVKFTAAGGQVTVRAVEDGENGVVITVADTGVGMTEAELEKALERFGQVENNNLVKSVPGTGLGLPLVAAITKLHGGRFDLASEKGKGTTVTVRLPWHGGLTRPI